MGWVYRILGFGLERIILMGFGFLSRYVEEWLAKRREKKEDEELDRAIQLEDRREAARRVDEIFKGS